MNDKMRAEFEAWWEGENGNRLYCESAWRGWQASCAAPAVQGEPVATLNDHKCFDLEDANRIMRLPAGTKLYASPQPAEQQPAPDVAELVEALDGAARSLETISRQAGIDEYMRDFSEVRGYARNRALVAFAALAAYRKGGEA